MATKKKAAKPAPKPARATGGKVAKPAKPAPKKAVPAKKPVAKPAPKKAAPAKKPVAKPAPKQVVPAKKVVKAAPPKKAAAKKIVPKAVTKPASKPARPAGGKPVPQNKPVVKEPMAKKPEIKKATTPAAKPAPEKKAPAKVQQPTNAKDIKITPAKPVALPKINTKTSRKYQPDFTKSVLDQPAHDLGAPIVRYSDADLTEFRELIQRKLESAKKELAYLQGLITRKDEMGGDNDDARYMTMEDGSMSMEREQLSQMASRQITFIDHLEKAIMRIENKTYGICRVTGRLIDKARLRAVPHATLSIEAKMGAVK
jgi:RNA polymerase-binding transcription factor DksA